MIRRWLIRLPFFLALTFVISIWVTSHFGMVNVLVFFGGRARGVGAVQGLGVLENMPMPSSFSPQFKFVPHVRIKDFASRPIEYGFYTGTFFGTLGSSAITFPLWLPTTFLALSSWFIWRKTRPNHPARGFPVEAGGAVGKEAKDA